MIQTSFTLLDRLRRGADEAAWERLVRLYTPLIRGWLGRHLPQPDDVDELTQQVFQVVVEKLPAFEHAGPAAPSAPGCAASASTGCACSGGSGRRGGASIRRRCCNSWRTRTAT